MNFKVLGLILARAGSKGISKILRVYIHADIESLKDRDPKGLYKKADNGLVTNLIGCSKNNPYEIPTDYDLLVNTSNKSDINKSKEEFKSFVLENL